MYAVKAVAVSFEVKAEKVFWLVCVIIDLNCCDH